MKEIEEILKEEKPFKPLERYKLIDWPFDPDFLPEKLEDLERIFVIRKNEIESLFDYIQERINQKNKKNIAVIGPNRVGKSTLLGFTFHFISLIMEKKMVIKKYDFKNSSFYIFPFNHLTNKEDKKELDDFVKEQQENGYKTFIFFHSPSKFDNEHIKNFLHYFEKENVCVVFPLPLLIWKNLEFFFGRKNIESSFDKIFVHPFTSEEIYKLLKKRLWFFRKGSFRNKLYPFTHSALKYISNISEGSPVNALEIAQRVLVGCAERMISKIDVKEVDEFARDNIIMKNNFKNLTSIQKLVLKYILMYQYRDGEGITPTQLAKERNISPSAATQILKSLLNKDLIYQSANKYQIYHLPAFLLEVELLKKEKKGVDKKIPSWKAELKVVK